MAATLAFDTAVADPTFVASGANHTFALTVASASGQERLVFVGTVYSDVTEADFSAVTVDGQTGTRIGTVSRGASAGGVCFAMTAWRATGTANTSINVVATVGGFFDTSYSGYCACYKLSGADTVLATTNAATNDPTLSVNTATGGTVAAALAGGSEGSGATVAWTGLTEDYDAVRAYSDAVFSGASANISSGSTPLAISADITPDLADVGTDSVASMCVSFNSATPPATSLTPKNPTAFLPFLVR